MNPSRRQFKKPRRWFSSAPSKRAITRPVMEVFNRLTFDPKARGTGTRLLNEIATGHDFFPSFSSDTNSFLLLLLLLLLLLGERAHSTLVSVSLFVRIVQLIILIAVFLCNLGSNQERITIEKKR